MRDFYDKVKENIAFRRKWAEWCGFGFELPSVVPNVRKLLKKPKQQRQRKQVKERESMVGERGFEPPTPWSRRRRSNPLSDWSGSAYRSDDEYQLRPMRPRGQIPGIEPSALPKEGRQCRATIESYQWPFSREKTVQRTSFLATGLVTWLYYGYEDRDLHS
jgi:hypothetical protein